MSGASSRRRGHVWERECANTLTSVLRLDIRTTRSVGASYGADLCTVTGYDAHGRPVLHVPEVLGFSIECKFVAARNPRQWLRQAAEQAAPGLIPVVLWRRKHHLFAQGSAFLDDPDAPRGWVEMPIAEWLRQCQDLRSQSTSVPVSHSYTAPSQ